MYTSPIQASACTDTLAVYDQSLSLRPTISAGNISAPVLHPENHARF